MIYINGKKVWLPSVLFTCSGGSGSSTPTLPAPVISLDADILTITDESGLAEEFDILVDGEVVTTVTVESDEIAMQTLTIVNSNNPSEVATFTIPENLGIWANFVNSEYNTDNVFAIDYNIPIADGFAVTYKGYEVYADISLNNLVNEYDTITTPVYYEGEAVEETYTLSGKWVWKKDPYLSSSYVEKIEFTSNGVEYTKIIADTTVEIAYNSNSVYVNGWNDDKNRIVDFGSTPQTVSAGFYEAFTANAVQEISGAWLWNEKLNQPPYDTSIFDIEIDYTSNGGDFNVLQFANWYHDDETYENHMAYYNPSTNELVSQVCQGEPNSTSMSIWLDEAYRVITLSEPVSANDNADFILWFIDNAERHSHEVTVTLQNGSDIAGWNSTTIYDDYYYDEGTGVISLGNVIGTIPSANGTVTVKTSTGKIGVKVSAGCISYSDGRTITCTGGVSVADLCLGGADNYFVGTATGNGAVIIDGIVFD